MYLHVRIYQCAITFLSLHFRKNLQDLDLMTESLKQKLTTKENNQTIRNEIPQQSGVSSSERFTGYRTISSKGQQNKAVDTNNSAITLSRSQGESIRTGGDSGAFSGENSYDKVHESTESQAPDSHRSDGQAQTVVVDREVSSVDRELIHRVEQVLSQSERLTNMCGDGGGDPALHSQRSDELLQDDKRRNSDATPDSGYRNGNFSMSTPRDAQTDPAGGALLQDFTNTLSTLEDMSANSATSTVHDSLKMPRDFAASHELSQGFVPGQMGAQGFVPGMVEGPGFVPGQMEGQGFVPGQMEGQRFVPGQMEGQGFVRGQMEGRGFVPGPMVGQGFVPGQMGAQGFVQLERDSGGQKRDNADRLASQAETEGFESNSDDDDDDDDEDDDEYGSYHQYKDLLENGAHAVDVDADDEAEEIQMIRPRTLNSVSAMLSTEYRVEEGAEAGVQHREESAGHHREEPAGHHREESAGHHREESAGHHSDESDSEFETQPGSRTERAAWTRQNERDGSSDSEDGAHRVGCENHRGQEPRPQTMVDSWLSETGENVRLLQGERNDRPSSGSSGQQPTRSRRLLSNVELIDTLTSTLSLGKGGAEQNKRQAGRLESVDLDDNTATNNSNQTSSEYDRRSRNTSQQVSSATSRCSRQSSATSVENPGSLERQTKPVRQSADLRQNAKLYSVDLVGKADPYKEGSTSQKTVKTSETDLTSPTSSAHSGPHLVNVVMDSRSHSQTDGHTDRVMEDSGVESGTKSSQDDKDVSYSSDQTHPPPLGRLPDFFMPVENMQVCMRALQVAIATAPRSQADLATLQAVSWLQPFVDFSN